jgi:PAS domain S-box-containing protein
LKKTEQALTKSEQKYAVTFESIGDGVITLDNEFKITLINKAAKDAIGWTNEYCMGKNLFDLINLPTNKDSVTVAKRVAEEVGQSKQTKTMPTLEFVRKIDGKKITIEDSISPIFLTENGSKKEDFGFVIVFRDISSKIESEKRSKELEEQLYHSRKMEAIDQFSGGIAHDFNNIITAINGFAEIMLISLNKEDKFYDSVVEIKRACARAAEMTDKLLTLSRKQVIHTQTTDINSIVEGFKEIAQRMVGEDIDIIAELKSQKNIKADTGQLNQIFLNLAANARDAIATKKGKTEDKKLFVRTSNVFLEEIQAARLNLSRGEYVKLEFEDTGCGISKENLKRVFEPFFTTKEKGRGTGLGLSTIYGIVKQNKGSIYVTSELGKGTNVVIYWPVCEHEREDEVSTVEDLNGSKTTGSETILFVEDEDALRKLSFQYLKSQGYNVILASNGDEALKLIQNQQIDIVVTDIVMPKMGGYELVEKITETYPQVKAIFMSGYNPMTVDNAPNFIGKPYSLKDLALKVRSALDTQ